MRTFAGAALHLRNFTKAAIQNGTYAWLQPVVEQGGKLT
jgi:hypothetical protein